MTGFSLYLVFLFLSFLASEGEERKSRSLNLHTLGSTTTIMGMSVLPKNTNLQLVHGRVDWTTKYGGHR